MPRVPPALPLVLAALCVLAAPLAVAAAGSGSTTTNAQSHVTVVGLSENTSRIVPLPDTQRANFSTPDASVMAALRMGEADARSTLSRRALERRLAAVDTRSARQRVLQNATARAEAAVDTLLEQERELRRDYLAGDLTPVQYVTALGELHARAEHLLEFIGPRGNPVQGSILSYTGPASSLQERLYAAQAELTPLVTSQGDRIATAIRGGSSPRVYVGASPNGFTVATISSGTYHRSVYRADFVDSTLESRLNITESRNQVKEYYPWAMGDGAGFISSGTQVFDDFAYRHRISHEHGTIVTYIDASTGLPYHETRATALSVVATEPGWTNTSANYTLAVNESYPGGPLRVQVTHNGTMVDAPVFVAGERVGVTGPDGVLWTLAPHGGFNVTVHVDGETLRVRASTS